MAEPAHRTITLWRAGDRGMIKFMNMHTAEPLSINGLEALYKEIGKIIQDIETEMPEGKYEMTTIVTGIK